jgi:precorrin isomerase
MGAGQDTLEWVARTAVYAAEQAGAADLIEDKKDYAIEVAEMWLESKRLPIDIEMIEAAIEAAVYSEINKDKAAPLPHPGTDES